MKRCIILSIGVAIFVSIIPSISQAQIVENKACETQLYERLRIEQDTYRQALYGSTGSNGEDDRTTYVRTRGTVSGKDEIGIFENKYRLTSELVEPALESYRSLRCRLEAVCMTLKASMKSTEISHIIQPLGCLSSEALTMDACHLAGEGVIETQIELQRACEDIVSTTLEVERSALRLAVSYDAGYRWIVQLTGMFDAALEKVPAQTFSVLRQTLGLLGKLHQIPCFLTQCDMPPVPKENP